MSAKTMSVREAAALLGVGADWLARQARMNKVPHVRLGHHRRFTEEQVDEIIRRAEQEAADPLRQSQASRSRARRSA